MTNQLPAVLRNTAIATTAETTIVPPLIANEGDAAASRYVEFFTANINNPNTRRAYARFLAWCETRGATLGAIRPFDVAAWIDELQENTGRRV
jgi:hypothetical protein